MSANPNDNRPFEIPAFLLRNPPKETAMTAPTQAPTAARPARKPRRDAYVARLTISIPLDMTDAETLSKAIKAIEAVKGGLPEGSTLEVASAGLGKMAAE